MSKIHRLIIAGWGRAGKDEAGAFLGRITELRYAGSTSWAALPFVAARLKIHPQLAWETRHARRQEWFEICCDLRRVAEDPAFLVHRALQSGEIVVGIRDAVELAAVKEQELVDRVLWIHRHAVEDSTVTFEEKDCDETIYNLNTLEDFHLTLFEWAVTNGLTLKRTPETEKLFRASRFYAWANDRGGFEGLEKAKFPAPFVFVPVTPFAIGNE